MNALTLFERQQRTERETPDDDAGGIITYKTATQLAMEYQAKVARLKSIVPELASYGMQLYYSGEHWGEHELPRLLEQVQRGYWDEVIRRIGVRKIMSAKEQCRLDDYLLKRYRYRHQFEDGEKPLPDLTPDTIMAVVNGYTDAAPEIFAEKVREEFQFWTTNRNGEFKSVQRWMAGEKLIAKYMVNQTYCGFRLTYYDRRAHVIALDSVFHYLDGKGIPDGVNGPFADAIDECTTNTGETEYFKFRCFKNGNLHVWLKRPDLVELFNRLGSDPGSMKGA